MEMNFLNTFCNKMPPSLSILDPSSEIVIKISSDLPPAPPKKLYNKGLIKYKFMLLNYKQKESEY